MADLKKLLAPILVTATALALLIWTFIFFDVHNPFFAFLVNWLIMSWVAILGQYLALPQLSASYYELKPFERSGRLYKWLGVSFFRKLVRRGPLTVFNPALKLTEAKTARALRLLEKAMRKAETSHLAIFVIVLFLVAYAFFQGWFDTAAWLLLFNILFNAYPVMLQRYNRPRIERLIHNYDAAGLLAHTPPCER